MITINTNELGAKETKEPLAPLNKSIEDTFYISLSTDKQVSLLLNELQNMIKQHVDQLGPDLLKLYRVSHSKVYKVILL